MSKEVILSDEFGKPDKNRKMMIEWSGSNPIYVGEAKPGTATSEAKWRIYKLTWSGGNVVSKQYADGTNSFTKVWDNRSSYTYS